MGASAVYTMPLALRMSGEVNEGALLGSLRTSVGASRVVADAV